MMFPVPVLFPAQTATRPEMAENKGEYSGREVCWKEKISKNQLNGSYRRL